MRCSLLAMAVGIVIFVAGNRRAPSGLLRLFINLVQTLTVMFMFDAPFPDSLVKVGRALSGLSLGVEVASPQCAGLPSGYYANFASTMLTLLLVCAGMMAAPLWAKRRNGGSWHEMAHAPEGMRGIHDLFVVVLLLHPTVSGKAMEFFRCQRINGIFTGSLLPVSPCPFPHAIDQILTGIRHIQIRLIHY